MKAVSPPSYDRILARMASLCARGEQSSSDILQKMRRSGLGEDDCRRALSWLKEHQFVDDRRFAGCFARDKVRFSGWGPRKILAALLARRIPSGMAEEAVESVSATDWNEALMRAARARARGLDISERGDRDRLIRHLASRGFGMTMILNSLKILGSGAENEYDYE